MTDPKCLKNCTPVNDAYMIDFKTDIVTHMVARPGERPGWHSPCKECKRKFTEPYGRPVDQTRRRFEMLKKFYAQERKAPRPWQFQRDEIREKVLVK
jgi:hypothetical protein